MNGRQPFALALSGGSALGAYQAGVYEALAAGDWLPDVVAGASIGAINAALIAGNAPEQRIERLRAFWRPGPEQSLLFEPIDTWRRTGAVLWSLMAGRSGVFAPQQPAWTGDPAGSLYDSRPLHDALGRLVDFDRLNAGEPRFLATTLDLASGEDRVFDTALGPIGPDHLRASAGLIPIFQPVEIDGHTLVDPGLSANLPIDPLLADPPAEGLLCIAVDLLPLAAPVPTNLTGLAERMQDLSFATQSRRAIEGWQRLSDQHLATMRLGGAAPPPVTLVQLSYADQGDEVVGKAFDFSPATIADRWRKGHRDGAALVAELASGAIAFDRPGLTVHVRHCASATAPSR